MKGWDYLAENTVTSVYTSILLILCNCQVLMNDSTQWSEIITVSVLIWIPVDESHSGVFCIQCK
jgi:hypothetical protein